MRVIPAVTDTRTLKIGSVNSVINSIRSEFTEKYALKVGCKHFVINKLHL